MTILISCVRKDMREFMRYKKNIICMVILMAIAAMVLVVTNVFPSLITQLSVKSPNLISDPTAMDGMFAKMFPADVKGSLGIVASDIGVFYTIVVALMCHSLLPTEIREGRWVMPINAGIKGNVLVAAKCIVYSAGMALPVFVVMNLYYYAASLYLEINIPWSIAFVNSIVLAFSIACIVAITIMTSIIYKYSIIAALSVIVIVSTAPDILTMFSFGKWFPTYLLTFTYNTESNISLVIIPVVIMSLIIIGLYLMTARKCRNIEITR